MSEQNNLAAFLRNLINAGMSTEEAIKHGFQYALSEAEMDAYYTNKLNAMCVAAQNLEQAAKEVGIHLTQQRAAIMERKRQL